MIPALYTVMDCWLFVKKETFVKVTPVVLVIVTHEDVGNVIPLVKDEDAPDAPDAPENAARIIIIKKKKTRILIQFVRRENG